MKKILLSVFGVLAVAAIAYAADITWTWTAPAVTATQGAATGYKLYQSTNPATCAATAPLPGAGTVLGGNILTASNSGLAEGTTLCSEVSATNAGGEGPRSNRVTKVIPVNPPGAPVLNGVINTQAGASGGVN